MVAASRTAPAELARPSDPSVHEGSKIPHRRAGNRVCRARAVPALSRRPTGPSGFAERSATVNPTVAGDRTEPAL